MSKNYDLYPKYERKIDNWRKRILGYEKMKRDMRRQIQILKNENEKQKEVIDNIKEYIDPLITDKDDKECYPINFYVKDVLLSILKEVQK